MGSRPVAQLTAGTGAAGPQGFQVGLCSQDRQGYPQPDPQQVPAKCLLTEALNAPPTVPRGVRRRTGSWCKLRVQWPPSNRQRARRLCTAPPRPGAAGGAEAAPGACGAPRPGGRCLGRRLSAPASGVGTWSPAPARSPEPEPDRAAPASRRPLPPRPAPPRLASSARPPGFAPSTSPPRTPPRPPFCSPRVAAAAGATCAAARGSAATPGPVARTRLRCAPASSPSAPGRPRARRREHERGLGAQGGGGPPSAARAPRLQGGAAAQLPAPAGPRPAHQVGPQRGAAAAVPEPVGAGRGGGAPGSPPAGAEWGPREEAGRVQGRGRAGVPRSRNGCPGVGGLHRRPWRGAPVDRGSSRTGGRDGRDFGVE